MVYQVESTTNYADLCREIRECADRDVTVKGCVGQRYIGCGLEDKHITVYGTPGNALGAYLSGAEITVFGNAEEATGDTMNGGTIVIHGSAGDATGYAMRGGKIYIRDNTGYRAGIHMKAYREHHPVIVIGGRAGSFLGEYQAGGTIVVLGQHKDGLPIINNFCGTGMHGGVMYLRCATLSRSIPKQVAATVKNGYDIPELVGIVEDYCSYFKEYDAKTLLDHPFTVLTPDTANPYRRMYTLN